MLNAEKNRRNNKSPEMFGRRLARSPIIRMAVGCLVILFLISSFMWMFRDIVFSRVESSGLRLNKHESAHYIGPQDITPEDFARTCLNKEKVGRSIGDIYTIVEALAISEVPICQEIHYIFKNIISLDEIQTTIAFPEEFKGQVKNWLGNNEALFQQMYKQKIYKVVNSLTLEETIYNPLRSRRPISKSGIDPIEYIEQLVRESQPSCDFCRYAEHTALDTFGRVVSKHSATASNTFKLAKFHGLFFPFTHNPVNLSLEVLEDLFIETSQNWFQRAHEADPSQRFPSLLWDSLPHAGASQVHPHVHGFLDEKQYAGAFEELHQGAIKYFETYGRSFWHDFVRVHRSMGLAFQEGSAVALVPVTARKDHEFWIVAPKMNKDVIKLLFRIMQAYGVRLNTLCHSSAAVYPVLGSLKSPNEGLPLIFRIGSRGDCTSLRSDVSSLELYTVNNINTDLSETMAALEETLSYLGP